MHIKVTWDEDFDDLMMHLWSKYSNYSKDKSGRELFTIDGIGNQMDLNRFREEFFSNTTTADVSVDSNANVSGKTCLNYKFESAKPFHRYDSYYILWKAIKDNFGLAVANEIIEDQLIGKIYINDFSSVQLPYCFNYSTYDIALEGLHNLVGDMYVYPPKSLSTFFRQVEQFATQAANSTMGAKLCGSYIQ